MLTETPQGNYGTLVTADFNGSISRHFPGIMIPYIYIFKSQEFLPLTATQGWLGLLASGQLNIIPSSLVFSRELADFPISQEIPKDLLNSSFSNCIKRAFVTLHVFTPFLYHRT